MRNRSRMETDEEAYRVDGAKTDQVAGFSIWRIRTGNVLAYCGGNFSLGPQGHRKVSSSLPRAYFRVLQNVSISRSFRKCGFQNVMHMQHYTKGGCP